MLYIYLEYGCTIDCFATNDAEGFCCNEKNTDPRAIMKNELAQIGQVKN